MKRYAYCVTESFCEEVGVPVYGITAYSTNSGQPAPLCCVRDISSDKETVSHLAERCLKLQLDPIHLLDVVEDFLL